MKRVDRAAEVLTKIQQSVVAGQAQANISDSFDPGFSLNVNAGELPVIHSDPSLSII